MQQINRALLTTSKQTIANRAAAQALTRYPVYSNSTLNNKMPTKQAENFTEPAQAQQDDDMKQTISHIQKFNKVRHPSNSAPIDSETDWMSTTASEFEDDGLTLSKKSEVVMKPADQPKTVDVKTDRDAKYKVIDQDDLAHFQSIVTDKNVFQATDEISPFVVDFTKKYKGVGSVVITPESTEQISSLLKYCNSNNIAVVPQGGNTGLVGGGVPLHDEVVISTKKMDQIIEFDEAQGVLICQAGCILENLQNFAKERGFVMPLDLGAKGSCQIGGNLATNAGGIKFIKYNSMHANCLGLKAVLADGTVLDNMNPHKKDSTGYDLKHLFIGSEGTLGFITECAILCPPMAKNRQICLLGGNNYDDVLKCLQVAKKNLSDSLTAIEFMDWSSASLAIDYQGQENPFDDIYEFYLLIEIAGNQSSEDLSMTMIDLLEEMDGHFEDGIVCENEQQIEQIWKIREGISTATAHYGLTFKFDISLASEDFNDIMEKTKARVDHLGGRILGHGHIGDGNLHLNIAIDSFDDLERAKKVKAQLEPFVFDYIKDKKGSISAEHGVGLLKANYLGHSKSPELISYMQQIKEVFDPNNILNPYKVLPQKKIEL